MWILYENPCTVSKRRSGITKNFWEMEKGQTFHDTLWIQMKAMSHSSFLFSTDIVKLNGVSVKINEKYNTFLHAFFHVHSTLL